MPDVPRTKTEYAANALLRMVQDGSLPSGAPINVGELARALGISTTPVREALRLLQSEGVLTHRPHHHVTVATASPEDLKDSYKIRAVLEGLAAELAAVTRTEEELAHLHHVHETMIGAVQASQVEQLRPLDTEFHTSIAQAARSARLPRLIASLRRVMPVDTFTLIPHRGALSVEQHQAVIDAIASRSRDKAGSAMRRHIEANLALLLWYIGPGSPRDLESRGPLESRSPGVPNWLNRPRIEIEDAFLREVILSQEQAQE